MLATVNVQLQQYVDSVTDQQQHQQATADVAGNKHTSGKLARPLLEGEDQPIAGSTITTSTTASPVRDNSNSKRPATASSQYSSPYKRPLQPLPQRDVTRPDGRSPDNIVSEGGEEKGGATPSGMSQGSDLSPGGISLLLQKTKLVPDNDDPQSPSSDEFIHL